MNMVPDHLEWSYKLGIFVSIKENSRLNDIHTYTSPMYALQNYNSQ